MTARLNSNCKPRHQGPKSCTLYPSEQGDSRHINNEDVMPNFSVAASKKIGSSKIFNPHSRKILEYRITITIHID